MSILLYKLLLTMLHVICMLTSVWVLSSHVYSMDRPRKQFVQCCGKPATYLLVYIYLTNHLYISYEHYAIQSNALMATNVYILNPALHEVLWMILCVETADKRSWPSQWNSPCFAAHGVCLSFMCGYIWLLGGGLIIYSTTGGYIAPQEILHAVLKSEWHTTATQLATDTS